MIHAEHGEAGLLEVAHRHVIPEAVARTCRDASGETDLDSSEVPWMVIPSGFSADRSPGRLVVAVIVAIAMLLSAAPAFGSSIPIGERILGQSAVEPAYDDVGGGLTYLLTPIQSPFPTHTSPRAVAPLYVVEYPPSYPGWTLNCMGVPGNCPDHNGAVAAFATAMMPSVYGTDPSAVPGHDHLVAVPASGGDFNVAWEVYEVLFTNPEAANSHLTTEAAIDAAVQAGDAQVFDLGFAFHCSVVSARAYWRGSPV